MMFVIKFKRPKKDLAPFESKYLDAAIVAKTPEEAVDTFNKYLGNKFGYKIINVSVIGYEED